MNPCVEALESRRLLATITQLLVPSGVHSGPDGIAAGPGNTLWFTEYNSDKIGVVNETTHAITEFPLPTNNAQPLAITEGPDGNMWFTESAVGQIGMINVKTDTITEYPLSDSYAIPYGITAGPNGTNSIWFTEEASNEIGMIDVGTGKVIAIPRSRRPTRCPKGSRSGRTTTSGSPRALGNQIGMIDPTSHVISEYGGPTRGSQPDGITAGTDGNLWFTEYTGNNVGMIDPTSHTVTEFACRQQPPGPAESRGTRRRALVHPESRQRDRSDQLGDGGLHRLRSMSRVPVPSRLASRPAPTRPSGSPS